MPETYEEMIERMYEQSAVSEYPATDIGVDENNTLYIDVSAPGFSKEDVKVTVDRDAIIIEGDLGDEDAIGIQWTTQDINQDKFKRVIRVSEDYIDGKVSATVENGIVNIIVVPQDNSYVVEMD